MRLAKRLDMMLSHPGTGKRRPDRPVIFWRWLVQSLRFIGTEANYVCPMLPAQGNEVAFGCSDLQLDGAKPCLLVWQVLLLFDQCVERFTNAGGAAVVAC